MRCCEYYSPNNSDDQKHEGLEGSDHYLFNVLVEYSACSNDDVKGHRPYAGCPVARSQTKCQFYSPDPAKVIKHVRGKVGETELDFRLEKIRVVYGMVNFQIVRIQDGEENVIFTFDAHAMGKQESFNEAVKQMKALIDEISPETLADIKIENTNEEQFSYILEAANAI